MSIDSPEDLAGLRAVGHVVASAIQSMKAEVRPGISTAELDEIGANVFRIHGARSAPRLVYGFPGTNCISLNDEAVHGIPRTNRLLEASDLVTIDVTAELDGYMADAATTVPVSLLNPTAMELCSCAVRAFERGLAAAKPGNGTGGIGRAVEREVERSGFRVLRELTGHGIGRTIHEPPTVPNFATRFGARLTPGMVITIEPIISATTRTTRHANDGWTILTSDGSLSAHHEHTVVIGAVGQPAMILTAA